MLTSCRYCGKIHDKAFDCGKRPTTRRYRRTLEEAGRYTAAFARKSREIKERSCYLCAVCLDCGIINTNALETHHIIKLRERPDLLLDGSNLICLCAEHHKQADRGELPADYLRTLASRRERQERLDTPPGGGAWKTRKR